MWWKCHCGRNVHDGSCDACMSTVGQSKYESVKMSSFSSPGNKMPIVEETASNEQKLNSMHVNTSM